MNDASYLGREYLNNFLHLGPLGKCIRWYSIITLILEMFCIYSTATIDVTPCPLERLRSVCFSVFHVSRCVSSTCSRPPVPLSPPLFPSLACACMLLALADCPYIYMLLPLLMGGAGFAIRMLVFVRKASIHACFIKNCVGKRPPPTDTLVGRGP